MTKDDKWSEATNKRVSLEVYAAMQSAMHAAGVEACEFIVCIIGKPYNLSVVSSQNIQDPTEALSKIVKLISKKAPDIQKNYVINLNS